MNLNLSINPKEGTVHGCGSYEKTCIPYTYFLINREFTVDTIVCDGKSNPAESSPVLIEDYEAQQIQIPDFYETLEIQYHGSLSGKSGISPYVKERITQDFTFLRWETLCYPFFCEPSWEGILGSLNLAGICHIQVEVPNGFQIVSSEILTGKETTETGNRYHYQGTDLKYFNFSCACAPYRLLSLPMGNFYLLQSEIKEEILIHTLNQAYHYMCDHFGTRQAPTDISFAAIPDGFGSFACSRTYVVFIQESSFRDMNALSQIVHEFIHLFWNVPTDSYTQRIRFFDEAFTCYFELRVMEWITGTNQWEQNMITGFQNSMDSGNFQKVPVAQFGEYEYGDLSYSIGALLLKNLCDLLGTESFDRIMRKFLLTFQTCGADLNDFVSLFTNEAGPGLKDSVRKFFEDWLYSCDGYEIYLKNC